MLFQNTTDAHLIKSVVCRPQIYKALRDERSIEEWEPIHAPGIVGYVSVHDGQELLGIVIVGMHNRIQVETHNLLLPHVGWKRRVRAASEFFTWLKRCGFLRVIGKVSASNRYAIKFNQTIGMKIFGYNQDCFFEDGVLQSELWFGISLSGSAESKQHGGVPSLSEVF